MCRELTKFFFLFVSNRRLCSITLFEVWLRKKIATFLLSSNICQNIHTQKTLPTRRPCLFLHFNSVVISFSYWVFLKNSLSLIEFLSAFFKMPFFAITVFLTSCGGLIKTQKRFCFFYEIQIQKFTLIKCIPVSQWCHNLNLFIEYNISTFSPFKRTKKNIRRTVHPSFPFANLRNTP